MLVGMLSGSAGNKALLLQWKRELECYGVLPGILDPKQNMSRSLLTCFILQSICMWYALKAMLLQDFWCNSPSLNHIICVAIWGLDWMGLDALKMRQDCTPAKESGAPQRFLFLFLDRVATNKMGGGRA